MSSSDAIVLGLCRGRTARSTVCVGGNVRAGRMIVVTRKLPGQCRYSLSDAELCVIAATHNEVVDRKCGVVQMDPRFG
jgi:hypothetical protein